MTNIPMHVHQLSVQENRLLRHDFLEVTNVKLCTGVIRYRQDVMIWTVMNEGNILMVSKILFVCFFVFSHFTHVLEKLYCDKCILAGEAQSQDMEICSGDSTPTSETSYSHSHTPTPHTGLIPPVADGNISTNNGSLTGPGPVLLANALPRLASHPPPSQPSPNSSGPIRLSYQGGPQGVSQGVPPGLPPCVPPGVPPPGVPPPGVPPPGIPPPGVPPLGIPGHPPGAPPPGMPPGVPPGVPSAATSAGIPSTVSAIPVISSTPPASVSSPCNPPVTLANLPHLLSQITQSQDTAPQKALKTIQTILSAQSSTSGPALGSVSEGPLVVDTSHTGLGDGPPTPTHSETQDCVDARKRKYCCSLALEENS